MTPHSHTHLTCDRLNSENDPPHSQNLGVHNVILSFSTWPNRSSALVGEFPVLHVASRVRDAAVACCGWMMTVSCTSNNARAATGKRLRAGHDHAS